MPFVPKDVIALPEHTEAGELRWVLMNVFTRTSLAVDASAFQALEKIQNGKGSEGPFQVWNVECFSNSVGLLTDPSRFKREVKAWGTPSTVTFDSLVNELKKHHLLIESDEAYRKVFGRKKNMFDREHIGNYHDQLGSHLILERKENPSTWWISQKFVEGSKSVRRDSLYYVVQAKFLEKYFPARIPRGGSFLDLGCGTGYFTNLAAKSGAKSALGVDPSEEYIQVARANAEKNATFEKLGVGSKGALASIPAKSLDFIFMSDALQFYFVPYGKDEANIDHLLEDITRMLKPGGTFTFMEPHPSYYQAPWLGSEEHPFTLKTEYRNRVQGIIPTLQEYTQAFLKGGFSLTWLEEVYPGEDFGTCDNRAVKFASEFPLWVIYEFRKGTT